QDSPGHPRLYVTTMAFLQHFGLESLEELARRAPAEEASS
ncbi:MAG: SMC-Scp complex subunit ScpB, partial [Chloroflexi bacterium]|nr:SMC-Scp complex subunit ScpB [Chloroflexota bacterium]